MPLINWPFHSSIHLKDNITDLLSVLPQFNLSFECDSSWSNLIQGGVHPLAQVLPHTLYIRSLSSLKFQRIMFVEQLFSYDSIFMMTWQDRCLIHPSITNHAPKWFTALEGLLLSSPHTSRR